MSSVVSMSHEQAACSALGQWSLVGVVWSLQKRPEKGRRRLCVTVS